MDLKGPQHWVNGSVAKYRYHNNTPTLQPAVAIATLPHDTEGSLRGTAARCYNNHTSSRTAMFWDSVVPLLCYTWGAEC